MIVQYRHLHIMAAIDTTNCWFKVERISKKIAHINTDIKFLQRCKKAEKIPKGLQTTNPLKLTYSTDYAERLCHRTSRTLLNHLDISSELNETTIEPEQLTERSVVQQPRKEDSNWTPLEGPCPRLNMFAQAVRRCNGTLCENLSGYVEGTLKPIVQGTPSFCRNTTDFLQKLSSHGPVEPGTFPITMDVSALYTSIFHNASI
eukprot:g24884.t1